MKRNKAMRGMAILLSIATLTSGAFSMTAHAGRRDSVVDNSSFAEELNTKLWSNPDEDILIKNGTVVFPKDSTEDTRLITTGMASKEERLNELFQASTRLKLKNVPEGQKFVFAFGLQSPEAYLGNNGNVEIAFTNQGGVKVAVSAYSDGGTETVIVEPVSCGSMNTNISIQAKLTMDGKLTLQVAGKTICKEVALPVSGEGHLGFLQTGECQVEISSVDIRVYKYEAPENPDVEENFDSGAMNTAVLSSKTVMGSSYYPQSLSIQEYKGNNVLMFERTNIGYIGTRYQYSNFEMTFDVPYAKRSNVRDENNEITDPKNKGFLVAFGGDNVNYSGYGYKEAADYINFLSNSQISAGHGEYVTKDDNHLFCSGSVSDDRGFSVKITVIDAVVTVGLKWFEEAQYTQVLTYTIKEGTPTGYIHIWSTGMGNYAIDNIKIINKDVKPNTITVGYTYDTFERPADFAYEEEPMVFRDVEVAEDTTNKGLGQYKMILYAGIQGVILLGISFAIGQIIKKKRQKQGGGAQNEE